MMNINDNNIYLIENVLSTFIPFFYNVENLQTKNKNELFNALNEIYSIVSTLTMTKKQKKNFMGKNSTIKLEEKQFLYKTYFSSSDTNNNYNKKIFYENSMQIFSITPQMLRGLIILIKEEISENKFVLINKLSNVKTIRINEVKNFPFKNLFILLEFIVFHFCNNIEKIIFEKINSSKTDQVETIIKNGIYLHFISKKKSIKSIKTINKLDFINENSIFKILYEYINNNEIEDIKISQINIIRINLIDILLKKTNLIKIKFNKISIDQTNIVEQLLQIIKQNNLSKIEINKFLSVPINLINELINTLKKKNNLEYIKLSADNIENIQFMNLIHQKINKKIKTFYLKINHQIKETILINELININNNVSELIKNPLKDFSFLCNKIILTDENFFNYIPMNLKYLTLGKVDHTAIKKLNNSIINNKFLANLNELKLYFILEPYEDVEESIQYLLSILKHGKMLKNLLLKNYNIKCQNLINEDIIKAISKNENLRSFKIRTVPPYTTQILNTKFYYYDLPDYLLLSFLFVIKHHRSLKKLYNKQVILYKIFQFFRIKKEKEIEISFI